MKKFLLTLSAVAILTPATQVKAVTNDECQTSCVESVDQVKTYPLGLKLQELCEEQYKAEYQVENLNACQSAVLKWRKKVFHCYKWFVASECPDPAKRRCDKYVCRKFFK